MLFTPRKSSRRARPARPNRGEALRAALTAVEERRDGVLPMDVDGVAETFGDELTLLGALQLRWHTRLAGRIERELMRSPMEMDRAVVSAWRDLAAEMPGLRAVLDQHRRAPRSPAMAEAMTRAADKERGLLAVMAGLAGAQDPAPAARVGERLEREARDLSRAVAAA